MQLVYIEVDSKEHGGHAEEGYKKLFKGHFMKIRQRCNTHRHRHKHTSKKNVLSSRLCYSRLCRSDSSVV
jgi:hypothetical protein